MEPVEFNGVPWLASVADVPAGLFVKAAGAFTLPLGYAVVLTRGMREWETSVAKCLRCPAGEDETWLTLTITAGPMNAKPRKTNGRRVRGWH